MMNGSRNLVVDGLDVHLAEAGSGAPLLLIHGLGGPQMWRRVLDPLAEEFRVISIDLPGFGDSAPPHLPYTSADYCSLLLRVLELLHCHRPVVAGISYGGQIAATFAQLHADHCSGLILIDSTGLWPASTFPRRQLPWTLLAALLEHAILPSERLTSLFGRFSFHDLSNRPPDLCRTFHRQILGAGRRKTWVNAFRNVLDEAAGFRGVLQAINVPALILWGADDRLVPVRWAYEFSRLLARSQMLVVHECSHSLPLEKPAQMCEAIVRFGRNLQPARAGHVFHVNEH